MGLRMYDEDDGLTSKILLMQATRKSKAKSWLSASLAGHAEDSKDDTQSQVYRAPDDFGHIQGDDENAGVGAPKQSGTDDDISNRQLSSANDALRKKLLSKDAYTRYQQGNPQSFSASKPKPKTERIVMEGDGEDDFEGRSGVARSKQSKVAATNDGKADSAATMQSPISTNSGQRKKRPGSYLDQLLAERGKKKQKKKKSTSKSEDG